MWDIVSIVKMGNGYRITRSRVTEKESGTEIESESLSDLLSLSSTPDEANSNAATLYRLLASNEIKDILALLLIESLSIHHGRYLAMHRE